jgi:4-amino-4-deoxy-L-arabinose transferase-like glycosyltransferase
MSAFALRLPNALAAIGIVVLTCGAGSRWFNPRAGLWAGILLLTFVQFALQAIGYRPDVLFTLMIAAGFIVYARGVGDRSSLLLRLAAFALFGLAMLAKGPLGLLLSGLVLVLWHGSRREWRRLIELAPLSIVALAVYLPWFVACARAMGSDNIFYELYAQNFQRFYSGSRGHERPVYYYFLNIWWDLLPWSLLLPSALLWVRRAGLWRDRNVQLLLWWFGTFLVFLSVAATKRQLYLLPAYPAIALLMAPYFASMGSGESAGESPPTGAARVYTVGMAIGYLLLGILLYVVAVSVESIIARASLNPAELEVARALPVPLGILATLLLISGIGFGLVWRSGRVRDALLTIGGSHIVIYVVLLAWVLPAFNSYKSYKPQSEWIREQIGTESRIGMVDPSYAGRKMGAFGYYTGAMVDRMESAAEVEHFFLEHPGSLVLVHDGSAGLVFGDDEEAWRPRVQRELRTGSRVYLVLRGP